MRTPQLCALCALGMLFAAWPAIGMAQPPVSHDDDRQCLRFRFGVWSPALDWKRSGHPSDPDSVHLPRAAGGQAWAVGAMRAADTVPGDTLFVLYPAFWPAGVTITVNAQALATRDSVSGTARALVADARQPTSTAQAVVKRVTCG